MAAGLDPSVVEANESIYHQGRALNHWLIVPLWPIYRFGPGTVWISGIVTIFGLKFIGLSLIAGILAFVWIAYVIYSWIAPRLVRRMQARRFR
jgi:hypothetical protein